MDEQELEDEQRIGYYLAALVALKNEHQKWTSNKNSFQKWDTRLRLKWIRNIEKQAAEGLPMAEQVMARALLARMTK